MFDVKGIQMHVVDCYIKLLDASVNVEGGSWMQHCQLRHGAYSTRASTGRLLGSSQPASQ